MDKDKRIEQEVNWISSMITTNSSIDEKDLRNIAIELINSFDDKEIRAKKEVFDDINILIGYTKLKDRQDRLNELKQHHLSTFDNEQKQHNYRKKKGSQ